jgi:hypothetical protein
MALRPASGSSAFVLPCDHGVPASATSAEGLPGCCLGVATIAKQQASAVRDGPGSVCAAAQADSTQGFSCSLQQGVVCTCLTLRTRGALCGILRFRNGRSARVYCFSCTKLCVFRLCMPYVLQCKLEQHASVCNQSAVATMTPEMTDLHVPFYPAVHSSAGHTGHWPLSSSLVLQADNRSVA